MRGEDFDVQALREQLGWSREKLASELEVSVTTIWRWESGKSRPIPALAKQLEALARRASRGKGKAA